MNNQEIIRIIVVIGFLALSLAIHEAAHAWTAYRCGDTTARDLGRMTLNPIVHIDLFWTILLPAFLYLSGGILFGGAKPVPVVPSRLRRPSRDMMFVALAGPISNLLLAVLFTVLYKLSTDVMGMPHNARERTLLPDALYMGVNLNVLLAVFNMIPIPPLDGSRVLAHFLPDGLRDSYVRLEQVGMLIVFAVIFWVRPVNRALFDVMYWVQTQLNILTGGSWA